MTVPLKHITVLLNEAVDGLAIKPDGIYLDGTFGRGGHSRLILSKLSAKGRLIAIDRDLKAIEEARKIDDPRFQIVHSPFSSIDQICEEFDLIGKVDGILLDLGVSSPQLDEAERGFSFMRDGPLDMRMDTSRGLSAAEWLAKVAVEDLAWVLKEYGEERFAKRIAQAVVSYNKSANFPISRTAQLAEIVANAVPFKDKHKHPATRTFQAIRIYINRELDELEKALDKAISVLAPRGRLSVISFHSLEDRMVKQFMRKNSKGESVPKGLPILECDLNKNIPLTTIGKAVMPTQAEIAANPRSRSAVLRVAEKRGGENV